MAAKKLDDPPGPRHARLVEQQPAGNGKDSDAKEMPAPGTPLVAAGMSASASTDGVAPSRGDSGLLREGCWELHPDCLCVRCRHERRRRLGEGNALVEEALILDKAKAIFGNVGHAEPTPPGRMQAGEDQAEVRAWLIERTTKSGPLWAKCSQDGHLLDWVSDANHATRYEREDLAKDVIPLVLDAHEDYPCPNVRATEHEWPEPAKPSGGERDHLKEARYQFSEMLRQHGVSGARDPQYHLWEAVLSHLEARDAVTRRELVEALKHVGHQCSGPLSDALVIVAQPLEAQAGAKGGW